MIFPSIIFLFIFLPLLLLICYLSNQKYHNFILLLASILFYAIGEPKYVFILLSIVLINYIGALLMFRFKNHKKITLIATIILNLGLLTYFKYFNFIIDNVNLLINLNISIPKIIMPIGISFYTFQAMSYLIDVYQEKFKPQKNLYKLALYICLFPQLVAGPIIKYHDIESQIESRDINFEKLNSGVKRFITGLAKKMLIANTLGAVADKIFIQAPDTFSHLTAWIGALTYSLQLFFDFSGYSDMAIGLGLIFGFKFTENFNYPYISKSISEFWRRWHISLSSWFKEYVYIPLGGNKISKIKTIRNLSIVFLLTGIWHGANWTFIVWGLWHGFFIIIEKIINIKNIENNYTKLWQKILQHTYCIIVFVLGWVLFRSDSLSYAVKYIANMFGFIKPYPQSIVYNFGYYIDIYEIIIFIIALLCCTPLFKNFTQPEKPLLRILANIYLILIFIISVSAIASNTYNPFIYFRF